MCACVCVCAYVHAYAYACVYVTLSTLLDFSSSVSKYSSLKNEVKGSNVFEVGEFLRNVTKSWINCEEVTVSRWKTEPVERFDPRKKAAPTETYAEQNDSNHSLTLRNFVVQGTRQTQGKIEQSNTNLSFTPEIVWVQGTRQHLQKQA